jgi:aldose 1-epimerase
MTAYTLVDISNDRSHCVLCPELGGSIVSWHVDGQSMLRTPCEKAIAENDPLKLGSFPLVPYSNRIDGGRFVWDKKPHSIFQNFPPEHHALHGLGWQRPWTVTTIEPNRCTLSLKHEADEHWPWSFEATQEVELIDGEMTIVSRVTNLSKISVPLAFGHHPYFDQSGASLQFCAQSVLLNDNQSLPIQPQPIAEQFAFGDAEPVTGREVDNCYTGWDGRARIAWEGRSLALEIKSDLGAAVVYIPREGETFCFEPVPHANNALNRPDLAPQMPVIEPEAIFEAKITMATARTEI